MIQPSHTSDDICQCGATTLAAFSQQNRAGTITSCWVAFSTDGLVRPGCNPNEWTNDLVTRRNARIRAATNSEATRPAHYPGDMLMQCQCGKLTRALTSSANEQPLVLIENPIRPEFALGPTTCWLAIADDGGPEIGCRPEMRTWEILARARGIMEPQELLVMDDAPVTVRVSDAARERFERLCAGLPEEVPTKKAKAKTTKVIADKSSEPKPKPTTKKKAVEQLPDIALALSLFA
jgi:hypothetical protein